MKLRDDNVMFYLSNTSKIKFTSNFPFKIHNFAEFENKIKIFVYNIWLMLCISYILYTVNSNNELPTTLY